MNKSIEGVKQIKKLISSEKGPLIRYGLACGLMLTAIINILINVIILNNTISTIFNGILIISSVLMMHKEPII